MNKSKQIPVVITTAHRGVFFGYINPNCKTDKTLELTNCRMAVYWSSEVKGVLGLASHGPTSNCRITRPVSKATIFEVTSILEVSSESEIEWNKEIWT